MEGRAEAHIDADIRARPSEIWGCDWLQQLIMKLRDRVVDRFSRMRHRHPQAR